ncbi:MAG: isopeptide-forming domain-containing fimbrial protein [Clostridiales bacterium]|nr:isopeptide-forming domain-containing fimbrial protein [Candidatus Apopatocola equi]
MKKVLAFLMALTLCLSLGVTAFAADANTTTITAPKNERTYEVYQIFTGVLEDGKLSDIQWGKNGTGTGAVAEETLDKIAELEKAEDIAEYADLKSNPVGTVTNGSSIEVPNGYYLIKDIGPVKEGEAYSLYVIEVVGPTTITPKDSVPEVEKVIKEGDEKVNVNERSVGDVIDYEITGTVPTRIADYNTYYYKFTDTLSTGLTYKEDMKVTVNGVDVTKYFSIKPEAADNGTVITVSIKDLKALALLENPAVGAITADTKVVLTYSAFLNESAVIDGPNENTVDLTYNNNPNDSGKPGETPPPENPPEDPKPDHPIGKTPKDEVKTYVTKLTVKKTDETGKTLTGAAFKLTGNGVIKTKVTGSRFEKTPYTAKTGETVQEGTYYKLANGKYTTTVPTDKTASEYESAEDTYVCVDYTKWVEKTAEVSPEAYVDKNGKLEFTGIGAGEYTLTETVTPSGYNTVAPIKVTVEFDEETGKFYIKEQAEVKEEDGKVDPASMTMEITVVNKAGTNLPETGGIGTKLFYIFGGIMVMAAVVFYTTNKRMRAED